MVMQKVSVRDENRSQVSCLPMCSFSSTNLPLISAFYLGDLTLQLQLIFLNFPESLHRQSLREHYLPLLLMFRTVNATASPLLFTLEDISISHMFAFGAILRIVPPTPIQFNWSLPRTLTATELVASSVSLVLF